jgi:peptidoglycan/xylan/chitin deacetylase (PgdA/CDA1 family)
MQRDGLTPTFATDLRVLCYHDVVDAGQESTSGFVGVGPDRFKLRWDEFRAQLDLAVELMGRGPLSAADLLAGGGGMSAWMLTFDDGGSSAMRIGEELQRRGWPGHFFVVTDRLGSPGFLRSDEVPRLAAMGHVVGSHSSTHPTIMSACPWPQLVDEWRRSREVLNQLLGAPVSAGAVPGGYFSPAVARAARAAGLELLFKSEPVRRLTSVGGCLVAGRFVVQRGMRTERAANAAAGRTGTWMRQRAGWESRGVLKTLAGERYPRLRSAVLSARRRP